MEESRQEHSKRTCRLLPISLRAESRAKYKYFLGVNTGDGSAE